MEERLRGLPVGLQEPLNIGATPVVGLIDYGAGNIHSIGNAIAHIGAKVQVIKER